jgi:hypothetical protein
MAPRLSVFPLSPVLITISFKLVRLPGKNKKTHNAYAMWVRVDAEIYLSLRRLPSDHTIARTPAAGTGSAGWKSARTLRKMYAVLRMDASENTTRIARITRIRK